MKTNRINTEPKQPKHAQSKFTENRRATSHEDWHAIRRMGRKAYDAQIRAGRLTQ